MRGYKDTDEVELKLESQDAGNRLLFLTAVFVLLLAGVSLRAQQTRREAIRMAAVVLPDRVRIRWDLPLVYPSGGFLIYRNQERLTPAPLRPVKMGESAKPGQPNNKPRDIVNAYLQFISSRSAVPEKEYAKKAATLNTLVLLRSIDSLEIARDLAIMFDDMAAQSGGQYLYRLMAIDATGRETLLDAKTVRVVPAVSPPAPSDLTVEAVEGQGVGLKWKMVKARSATDPAVYNVYRTILAGGKLGPYQRVNPTPVLVLNFKDSSGKPTRVRHYFYDQNLEDGVTVKYRVVGVDFFGRESVPVESQPLEYADNRPPMPVEDLTVKTTATAAILHWRLPVGSRAATVEISRSQSIKGPFEPVGKPLPPTLTSLTNSSVTAGHKYFYRVETRNRRGKLTALPRTVLAEVFNDAAPSPPVKIKASARPGEVTLAWAANPESDIAGYRVYRSLSEAGEYGLASDELVGGLSYADQISLTQRNRLWYRVTAVNTSNKESKPSALVAVEPPFLVQIDPPVLRTAYMSEGKIVLEWNRPDDPRIAGYLMYRSVIRNDEMVQLTPKPLPPNQLRYEDTNTEPDHPYYYAISAVDAEGHRSVLSAPVTASTFSNAPVPVPTGLSAATDVGGNAPGVTLNWKLPEHSRLRCLVLRSELADSGFVRVSSLLFEGQNTYTDSDVRRSKTYYYRVRTMSPAGATSSDSATIKVAVPSR